MPRDDAGAGAGADGGGGDGAPRRGSLPPSHRRHIGAGIRPERQRQPPLNAAGRGPSGPMPPFPCCGGSASAAAVPGNQQ
eukprot:scaffold2977_cov383-Prasinococcus_capsulatus_cf.AAC.5